MKLTYLLFYKLKFYNSHVIWHVCGNVHIDVVDVLLPHVYHQILSRHGRCGYFQSPSAYSYSFLSMPLLFPVYFIPFFVFYNSNTHLNPLLCFVRFLTDHFIFSNYPFPVQHMLFRFSIFFHILCEISGTSSLRFTFSQFHFLPYDIFHTLWFVVNIGLIVYQIVFHFVS